MYLQKAGTIILFTSILLYVCNTYPEKKFTAEDEIRIESIQNETGNSAENIRQAEAMEYTISGRVGRFLEPVFAPIGFDWQVTTATIGALAAKEVFVAQMGILYSEGSTDEESDSLRTKLVRHYTPLQAFCIMLFCLLSIPCLATLAVIRRELNSWKMAFVEAGSLFALAYIATFAVYQLGRLFQIGDKLL
jgi:ferrous iron transport protein B